jgi:hypothetical protein
MKHVIVIEFSDDDPLAGRDIKSKVSEFITLFEFKYLCFAHTRYNVESAIEATHEMFNAPKWTGGQECKNVKPIAQSKPGV